MKHFMLTAIQIETLPGGSFVVKAKTNNNKHIAIKYVAKV